MTTPVATAVDLLTADVATQLAALLDAVHRGQLEATSGQRYRLEGALTVLRALQVPATAPVAPPDRG